MEVCLQTQSKKLMLKLLESLEDTSLQSLDSLNVKILSNCMMFIPKCPIKDNQPINSTIRLQCIYFTLKAI